MPEPGDGPDAILARAERQIDDGDIVGALATLEALPADARDALRCRKGAGVHLIVIGFGRMGQALTVEACRARGLEITGIIGGSISAQPDAVAECVVEQVPIITGLPVLAWLPEGAADLDREEFLGRAAGWFSGTTLE